MAGIKVLGGLGLAAGLVLLAGGAYGVHHLRVKAHGDVGAALGGGKAAVVKLVKNPEQAPSFELIDLAGKPISPKDSQGKVVLLNFWATWCAPCRAEIPELISLQKQYHDRLQIIGVSEDDDPPEKVRKFAEDKGINYPIVMATPDLIAAYGGVPALPTTFVLDSRGRVVQKHAGVYPEDAYNRELHVLMNLPTDARVETFDDTGQVFLKNAASATELPGVDLSGLTDQQKKTALHRLNAEGCTCGCGLTVAECRINDTECPVSMKLSSQIVDEVRKGLPAAAPATEPAAKSPKPNT